MKTTAPMLTFMLNEHLQPLVSTYILRMKFYKHDVWGRVPWVSYDFGQTFYVPVFSKSDISISLTSIGHVS